MQKCVCLLESISIQQMYWEVLSIRLDKGLNMANKKICFKQTFQLLKDLMSVYFTLKNTRIFVNKTLKLKKSTGMYSTQMKTQMINFCKINHNWEKVTILNSFFMGKKFKKLKIVIKSIPKIKWFLIFLESLSTLLTAICTKQFMKNFIMMLRLKF